MTMRMPISLAVLLCMAGTALGQAPAAPATQPDSVEARKAQQRQFIEKQYANRPVIGPFESRQVVQIEIDDGHFAVDTALPAEGGEHRIEVKDDPGLWWGIVNHRPGGTPMYMVVQRYDFSNPDNIFSHAMVTASTTQISLSGTFEDDAGMLQVELIDRSPMATPEEGIVDPGGIRIFLNGYDSNGINTLSLRIEASDFHALRAAHPDIVNTHLRRVLEELGQGHVLAMDEKLAWQVLGGERPVDPKVVEQVQALLHRLDADAFAEREQAAAELLALGEEGAAAIAHLDRSTLTPEQNARIDEFLRNFNPVSEQKASVLANDPEFLLDVLLVEDAELRKLALERLRERIGKPIAFDLDASPSQRARQVALLRKTLHYNEEPTTRPTQ